MSQPAHASLALAPEKAKPGSGKGGDCCAEEPSHEAGLPRFLAGAQGKIEVGPPGDALEREADAVAEAVQRRETVEPIRAASGAPRFQRLCAECAGKLLDRLPDAPQAGGPIQRLSAEPEPADLQGQDAVSGLVPAVRDRLEQSLGTRLGSVRVHTGPGAQVLAQLLGARAFARGEDIWLAAGERPDDLGLMAHEVTHVLQQTGGSPAAANQAEALAPEESLAEALDQESEQATGDSDDSGSDAADDASDGSDAGAEDAGGTGIGGTGAGDAGAPPTPSDAPSEAPRAVAGAVVDTAAKGIAERFGQAVQGGPAAANAASAAAPVSASNRACAPIAVQGRAGIGVQRKGNAALEFVGDLVEGGTKVASDVGGAISTGVEEAGKFAGNQLMKLVRKAAPQVADIIDEGPINFAKRKINEALDAHLPDALGGFSVGDIIDAVSGWLGEAATFAKSLLKGDAKACAAFAGLMDKLTQFVTKLIDNPVVKTITGVLKTVTDFAGKALKFVAAPIFDAIAKQVSGAWSALKKIASVVSGWISSAKKAVGKLWDQLVSALGFDGSDEDGVWAHIKKVGSEIWEAIKAKMAPVIEPLKKVASVVALLTPMGQVHAIVKYGPKLVKVVQWVWTNGMDPAKIREAPEDIRGMLTDLSKGTDGFKGVLSSGLNWLEEKFSSFADSVLSVVTAITGLPLIGFAHSLFDDAKKTLKTIVADVKKGAKDALAGIEAAATKISDFIAPYKEVLGSLILAIAAPPMIPVIFAGWAWRKLPSCVKVPIINFILDIAITALDAIPEVPTFGVLWPLLKPGVMAFMGTLRAADDETKELISDKIAKVISGASPDFLIGFVKGFATGVWEGITDPFKAIWTVLEGLDSATQYLLSLAGFSDEKKEAPKEEGVAHRVDAPKPAAAAEGAKPSQAISSVGSSGELRKAGGAAITARSPSASATPPAAAAASSRGTISAISQAPASAAAPSGSGAGSSRGVISKAAPGAALAPAAVRVLAPGDYSPGAASMQAASPKPAPAAQMEEGKKEEEKPYVADPAAELAQHGANMPEATRRLMEKLAAQKAAGDKADAEKAAAEPAEQEADAVAEHVDLPEADLASLKEQAGAVGAELAPDVAVVKGGFWDAVQDYFSAGKMSFDDLVVKLSEAWETGKAKIAEGASWLANHLMGFFKGGGAEGELGDKVGWLTGTIAFQALLDAITAGTWAGAGPVLKGIAKFINWPMEALGEAFKLLKTLGKYLLDGIKKLGGAIKDAAAGAFKAVSKALGNIGSRLLAFGEQILGKFGGKAAKVEAKAASTLGKEGTKLAESKLGKEALGEAEQKTAQKLEGQAGKSELPAQAEPAPKTAEAKPSEPSADARPTEGGSAEQPKSAETRDVEQVGKETPAKREASAAESGKLENDKLTPQQTRNETDRFRERPEGLEGTAPHRKSKAGKHEWREETLPTGECQFCRYSPTKICVNTPELRAKELQKVDDHALALQKQADAQAKAAAEAREKAMAHQPLGPEDKKLLDDELAEAEKRAEAAKKRLSVERGKATRSANAGKTDEALAAQKRAQQLEAEAKRARDDAQAAKDLIEEQQLALRKAEEMEAAKLAAQKEAQAAAETAEKLKAMEKNIATAEADLANALKKNKQVHTPETLRMEEDLARQRKALAEQIEASKGLTAEARDTLRKGTPFNGPGGAERERAFLDALPPEAKGPNGTYVDYVTGQPLPLSDLRVDHVVPVDQIFGMDGFGRLSRVDQQAILDMPQNLRFLEASRNSSKGARSFAEWFGGGAAKAPKLPAAERQALLELEAKARADLQAEIARRLKKAAP